MTRAEYQAAVIATRSVNDRRQLRGVKEEWAPPWPFDARPEVVTEEERSVLTSSLRRRSAFQEVRDGA